jgi:hypothetical protein
MRTTRHCLNIVISGALAFGRGESFDDILSEMGNGAMTGAVLGAVSGFASGIQYAREHKISPWTGEKTHEHHSFPKSLGGAVDQELTPMSASRHIQLHNDMREFLKNNPNGNMLPRKHYNGNYIQNEYTVPVLFEQTKYFYDSHQFKYWDARLDFYRNNHLFWHPW